MRAALVIAFVVLSGCPAPSSYPLQICSEYDEPCAGAFECLGFHCVADCRFEGDCDLGFRCKGERCLQSCEAQDDCTIGVCEAIGDGRPGSACELRNLPQCGTDDHCNWGLCVNGGCLSRCDWVGECGLGSICDFRRGDYGTCVPDPDYVPPPPITACFESPAPDQWCQSKLGVWNAYCDGADCARYYPAVAVVDESPPEACLEGDEAPGTDLMSVQIFNVGETYSSFVDLGEGPDNLHVGVNDVQTFDAAECGSDWVSLGCGGVAVFIDGQAPLSRGSRVEVRTQTNWCEPGADVASVYLCDDYPYDRATARQSCVTYLGPVSDVVLTVP